MATSGAEDVPESEIWGQDELSEMTGLLQRAEQRMKKSHPVNRYTVKATKSDKHATPPPSSHATKLTLNLEHTC